jgi:antitoxin component YwqK of YwqJK toxin-antitoxin module
MSELRITHNSDGRREETNYVNGKKEGISRLYYQNGQLWEELNYNKDGKMEGTHKEWHQNGVVCYECYYVDGKREGFTRTWHQNGQLIGEYFCVNDKIEGVFRSWFANGQFLLECVQGFCKRWNWLTGLYEECHYACGLEEGNYMTWYANRLPCEELFYLNGERDGPYKKWFKSGQIQRDQFYRNGVLVYGTIYEEDGKVKEQISSRRKSARS